MNSVVDVIEGTRAPISTVSFAVPVHFMSLLKINYQGFYGEQPDDLNEQ